MKKWFKRISLGLLALVVVSLLGILLLSEWKFSRQFEPQARLIQPATDPNSIAEGERLARVFGCYRGCHGRHMEGVSDLFSLPDGTMIRSTNLTKWVGDHTPAEFEAVVRQGIRPDGRSVDAMPSASFAVMSDEHLEQILGFILNYPKQDNEPGTSRLMPMARFFMLKGDFKMGVDAMVEGREPVEQESLGNPVELGRYLALSACSECHGMDLGGDAPFSPALAIVRGYDLTSFTRLMREGIALGDREVGLMSQVASFRLMHLTDREIAALYDYLNEAPIPLTD